MSCVNLRKTFGRQYKVAHEQSFHAERPEFRAAEEAWLQVILCQSGHIFPWGGDLLAASTAKGGSVAKRLKALPGVEVVQDGADGATVVFPVDRFDEIAQIIKPRRRRRLSPEARARAVERLRKYRFQPAVGAGSEAPPCVSSPSGDSRAPSASGGGS